MSNITVNIEFLAGTKIEDAILEAKEKAIEWKVAYIDFNFNGQSISVGQKCDIEKSIRKWKEGGIKSKYGYIFN